VDAIIKGEVTLTEQDLTRGYAASPQSFRAKVSLGAGIVGLALASFLFAGPPFILLGMVPMLVILHFLTLRNIVRRQLRAMGDDARHIEYAFDDEVFRIQNSASNLEHRYDALQGLIVSRQCFLLYTAPQLMQVVPRRAFTDADSTELERRLRAKVKPMSKHRPALRVVGLWLALIALFFVIFQLLSLSAANAPREDQSADDAR